MRHFNKGAMVSFARSISLTAKLEMNRRFGKFVLSNNGGEVTGAQLAAVANRARQRKKGPLVRFGRKP